MATRRAIYRLKNNQTNNGTLPTSGVQMGEPLVNLYNGIVFFSGTTGGDFTQSNLNSTYFEVGSNLYNLKLRNQITTYSGVTGAGLVDKFLRGTSTGFVLDDISNIAAIDSYVTGATWSPNTLTLTLSNGKPSVPVTINTFNNITLYGTNTVNGDLTVTGTTILNGPAYYNNGATVGNEIVNYGVLTSYTQTNDVYVTGFTYNSGNNGLTISRNQGQPDLTAYINAVSGLTVSNLTPGQVVYVGSSNQLKTDSTGEFAYNESTNVLTLGTTSGNLVVNNGLANGPATFGQGGVTIGSGGSHFTPGIGDLVVHGNFIVFGTGTTVATNELYVEDPQITLNYNPTGDTSLTSISSGFRIQNGAGLLSGVTSGDTYFTIAQMNTLTGIDPGNTPSVTEYTSSVGYSNRGWLTQLNDIVIRNNNFNNGAPNGVRVLAEFDILDGGQY